MLRALAFALLLVRPAFADCDQPETVAEGTSSHEQLTLTKVKFSELPGWADDKLGEAVPSFLTSCKRIGELKDDDPVGTDGHGGKAKQWRRACTEAARLKPGDDAAARTFFEAEFVPYSAGGKAGT